jgi:hypothetical protein
VIRVLERGNKSTSLPNWEAGTVWLKEIKIPVPKPLDEPVEYDSLVAQVQETFASFTSQEVDAVAAIAWPSAVP